MQLTTVADVLRRTGPTQRPARLPKPPYVPDPSKTNRVGMAVSSMQRHMTDEGWQIFAGLEHAGYTLTGKDLPVNLLDTKKIIERLHPGTVVLQDKREWDKALPGFRDKSEHYSSITALGEQKGIFRVTVLKDAHQRPDYHRDSADEIEANGWITYYHPAIVRHLAPFVRTEHCVRTYHSVDREAVPAFEVAGREGVLLSGASCEAYPFRRRLIGEVGSLYSTKLIKHPGYHANGSHTVEYLKTFSRFKVAICTASMYGYVLRKMVEATACGCVVITDLPVDEVVPEIDGNLVRVSPKIPTAELNKLLRKLCDEYSPERQSEYAERTKNWFDFRVQGQRLADNIEALRLGYLS